MTELERLEGALLMHARVRRAVEDQMRAGKALAPGEGYTRNPLLELPRNVACPCKSGKKWKACCMPLTHPYIPKDVLAEYLDALAVALDGDAAW